MSAQLYQTLCQDVTRTEYGEESIVCIFIVRAFSISLKYIDLNKKHYFIFRHLCTKLFEVLTDSMQKTIRGLT